MIGRLPTTVTLDIGLQGLLVAERYAKAFVRDAPLATQMNIKRMQCRFHIQPPTSARDTSLRFLNDSLDEIDGQGYIEREEWLEFANAFVCAIVDVDEQCLEIREARKKLYDNDDILCRGNIDLELWRSDEMIDFYVDEPSIGADNEWDSQLDVD